MSTKLNPGAYDCYAKLAPDEPYFVLRAKDPHAPALVELWAALREAEFGHFDKLDEARKCAAEMRAWFTKTGQKTLAGRTSPATTTRENPIIAEAHRQGKVALE